MEHVIFADLAERHIPVSPKLAASLATAVSGTSPRISDPWTAALDLAGRAVGQTKAFERVAAQERFGDIFLSVVAEPILRRAGESCRIVLLSGLAEWTGEDTSITAKDYDAFCTEIDGEVNRLLSSIGVMGHGFWAHAALNLQSANLFRLQRGAGGRNLRNERILPAIDPLLVSLVFALEPDLGDTSSLKKKAAKLTARSKKLRVRHKLKEDGVTGVTVSRRVEDLQDALVSELTLPSRMLLQKIIEDGFLVRERPPRRKPKRNLLCLAFPDPDPVLDWSSDVAAVRVAKAAWQDAAIRASIVLAQSGKADSNFVWCEARNAGVAASHSPVEALSVSKYHAAFDLALDQRRDMIMRSPFIPSLFDMIPPVSIDPPDGIASISAALKKALGTPMTLVKSNKKIVTDSVSPEDFLVANVFVLRPAHAIEADRTAGSSYLRITLPAKLRLRSLETCRVHMLYLPDQCQPGGAFKTISSHKFGEDLEIGIPERDMSETPISQGLGGLSAWMIDQILDSLHGR
ncbi:MAG: hypothetical protein ABJF07_07715 [Nisaea sp.]|uniref:hypothetical protein n=1 Tax=Nisaea sp. TaxID=2024842 RepID=UPI0032646831